MFSNLFNYDNPVWRFIGKFWDVLVVNLLWIICSIPIVTIGASTTAMYYVTLRLVRDEDGYTIRSFFKSFKDNFKQATAIWLIFLVVGLILGFDLYFVLTMMAYSTLRTVMTTVFLALLFIWFAMFTFVFPLQSRFYNPVKKTIFNAFFMSIRHIFYTIGIVVMDVVLVLLTSSLFIWRIDVTGNETLTTGQILRCLDECGVRPGTYWPALSNDLVRNDMILCLPELRWLTVNVHGSRAEVIVREKDPLPDITPDDTPVSIYASATMPCITSWAAKWYS